MPSFPTGFELLLTGLRHGNSYAMHTAEPESFAELIALLQDFPGPIITFNGAKFDLPLLEVYCQRMLGASLPMFRHYDLLQEIVRVAGHRISLDNVSYYTLGQRKVHWDHRWNGECWESDPHRLIDYNRVDLDLTHELFTRVLHREPLFLRDRTVVLPLPDNSC